MERGRSHGKNAPPPPLAPPRPARRAERERASGSGASFSASLLDTIYRSLDDGGVDGDAARRSEEKPLAPAPPQFWWAGKPKQAAGADRRRRETGPARPRHSGYASSATSSSDSTSSYSFSCSSASTTDTESTCRRRSPPPPRRQLEEFVAPDSLDEPVAVPVTTSEKAKKKGRPCFPVGRHRPRDAAPSSPGPPPPSPGTFACVLKALFTSGRLPRKPRTPTRAPPPQMLPELPQPSCVSAATDASMAERRCVRFCSEAEASVVRRRVEELVRSLGELEEDDEGSDSSSDLFELENLAGANGDELPVYGTTSLVANRAIAHATVF
ncbi:protein BIG GRAIN 1-like [Hordeum vulgare subsp. vulgare]|uniref:Uncharacterized protein n=1 Tax=Hordeum vulgare subsp. vulgare TaxID=112509 RepID=A0A8I6XQ91_HORVV|nr:protein BIG GRAIN 1-like [Hordeum vulgare subsp. vulgare]